MSGPANKFAPEPERYEFREARRITSHSTAAISSSFSAPESWSLRL